MPTSAPTYKKGAVNRTDQKLFPTCLHSASFINLTAAEIVGAIIDRPYGKEFKRNFCLFKLQTFLPPSQSLRASSPRGRAKGSGGCSFLKCRGGCPHPPAGIGRWKAQARRDFCGHRPLRIEKGAKGSGGRYYESLSPSVNLRLTAPSSEGAAWDNESLIDSAPPSGREVGERKRTRRER